MKKHSTKLMAVLLAAVMLLPLTVQAVPAEGWTAEAEQVYQTVTELVVQQVSERKDYIAAATQAENAKAVYALWTSSAAVPDGFYDEYLQALADWLDLAVKRGKTAYIPGAIRTVAAMGLDVTDLAGHDLMDALRKPELEEEDEDRLDMLMDLDAAGDAGKTDEFNALRENLLTEALADTEGVPRTHWPLEKFERPPNHAVRQYKKAEKKPWMALCGHPWLFLRFLLRVYRPHCREPPCLSFSHLSKQQTGGISAKAVCPLRTQPWYRRTSR